MSPIRREAERALRAGDIALACELCAVAEAIEADELRRVDRQELRRLVEPELHAGCGCEVSA